jgi:hypothetical protein
MCCIRRGGSPASLDFCTGQHQIAASSNCNSTWLRAQRVMFMGGGFTRLMLRLPPPLLPLLSAVSVLQLADHLNAEVVAGTITTRQDALDYLTWTYFYRCAGRLWAHAPQDAAEGTLCIITVPHQMHGLQRQPHKAAKYNAAMQASCLCIEVPCLGLFSCAQGWMRCLPPPPLPLTGACCRTPPTMTWKMPALRASARTSASWWRAHWLTWLRRAASR